MSSEGQFGDVDGHGALMRARAAAVEAGPGAARVR
jgi:hypothetical protein